MEAKSSIIANLVTLADAYCAATGRSRSAISKIIHGRGSQIDDLAKGQRDLTTGIAESAMQWFSGNWPADAIWPAGIDRPQAQGADAGDDDKRNACAGAAPAAPSHVAGADQIGVAAE